MDTISKLRESKLLSLLNAELQKCLCPLGKCSKYNGGKGEKNGVH